MHALNTHKHITTIREPAANLTTAVQSATELLDRTIPLDNASHADVEHYGVDIPMRYASLYAVLKSGRKARLVDARMFRGWSGREGRQSFLFRSSGLDIEIQTDDRAPVGPGVPGNLFDLIVALAVREDTGSDGIVVANRHWSGIRSGVLGSAFEPREESPSVANYRDRKFIAPDGSQLVLCL